MRIICLNDRCRGNSQIPVEAEFLARLEGTLQADDTLAWGPFTILLGVEARQARRVLDNARNHAGWPSF